MQFITGIIQKQCFVPSVEHIQTEKSLFPRQVQLIKFSGVFTNSQYTQI